MDNHKGDHGHDSFSMLVEPVLPLAYNYLYKDIGNPHIVEDILQNALEKALVGFKGFRGESSFKTWFFKILINEKYSLLKELIQQRKIYSLNGAYDPESEDAVLEREKALEGFSNDIETMIINEDTRQLISVLPENDRQLIELLYFKDRTIEQAANLLHKEVSTVRSRKRRILDILKTEVYIRELEEELSDKTDALFEVFLKERLSKSERSLFIEVVMNKRSFKDISIVTGTDENRLRTKYLRTLKKLADHMRRDER